MSDIEARREARRRRILENSGKRLQKITGVEQRNGSYQLEGYQPQEICEEPQITASVKPQITASVKHPELPITNNSSNNLNYSKTHRTFIIIFIAIFVNVLITIFGTYSYANKIFIPLLCFEAIDLIYNRNNVAKNDNLLMLLFASQNKFGWMLKYLGIFKTIFTDLLLYFFVFVIALYIQNCLIRS